jgi:hypothetical protein
LGADFVLGTIVNWAGLLLELELGSMRAELLLLAAAALGLDSSLGSRRTKRRRLPLLAAELRVVELRAVEPLAAARFAAARRLDLVASVVASLNSFSSSALWNSNTAFLKGAVLIRDGPLGIQSLQIVMSLRAVSNSPFHSLLPRNSIRGAFHES